MPICIGRKISSISKKGSPQIIEIYGKLSSVGARSPCYIWSSSCLLYGWQERLQSKGCGVSETKNFPLILFVLIWFYTFWWYRYLERQGKYALIIESRSMYTIGLVWITLITLLSVPYLCHFGRTSFVLLIRPIVPVL